MFPVHPQLHFISHIPHTIKGEQLIAQLFRCIPEKSWLFKYGCVPMSLILGEWIWEVCFFRLLSSDPAKNSCIALLESIRISQYSFPLQSQCYCRSCCAIAELSVPKNTSSLWWPLPSTVLQILVPREETSESKEWSSVRFRQYSPLSWTS